MRIETNFVAPMRMLAGRVVAGAALLALALAAATIFFWLDGAARRSETREAVERLQQLEARRASIGGVPGAPSRAEFSALQQRVETINALSATNGRQLVPLLALFEELLPPDAWLVKLAYKPREGEVAMVAEANRAEQLTQFLSRLEKSSRFAEVLLTRQTPLGAEGRRTVQFELRLKERP